jgi:hypothetical protein
MNGVGGVINATGEAWSGFVNATSHAFDPGSYLFVPTISFPNMFPWFSGSKNGTEL